MRERLIIGSRGSKLALTQSEYVASLIKSVAPDVEVSIEVFSTRGDRILDRPLAEIGGKGLFTEELEAAMQDGRIDMAVHSMKDLPTELTEGMCVGCVPPRESPYDAFVSGAFENLDALPQGAKVGTSSLRRKAQLLARRPDLNVVDIRGNVQTRTRKTTDGTVDAAILACAGIMRLERDEDIRQVLPIDIMVPAVGQGALAVEVRSDDDELLAILKQVSDDTTWAEVDAERSLLAELEGGCQVPMGALARVKDGMLSLTACVCSLDGAQLIRTEVHGPVSDAIAIGRDAAARLREAGAEAIIKDRQARLHGKRIVVTRAARQADGLSDRLQRSGAVVIEFPTIEIAAPEEKASCDAYDSYDWIVLTSVNGVEMFLQRLNDEGVDPATLTNVKLAAVGSATKMAVEDAGLTVDLVPPEYVAESMLEALRSHQSNLKGQRFLLPRADIARSFLPDALRDEGAVVDELIIYRTIMPEVAPAAVDALVEMKPAMVVFTSSSTAKNFHTILGPDNVARMNTDTRFASIGPITTETAEGLGMPIAVQPDQHDIPGLVQAIEAYYNP